MLKYAATSRQDILGNRHNIAQNLGFLGRIVHGHNTADWLKELEMRIGKPTNDAGVVTQ